MTTRTKEFTKERAEEKPMTVGELRQLLETLPPEMELIQTRYSDYGFQKASMWSVIEAIPGKSMDSWLMRTHPSMTKEQRSEAKTYLHIEGN